MMSGITILSTRELMEAPNWTIVMALVGIVVTFISFIIITKNIYVGFVSFVIGCILSMVCMISNIIINKPTGKYEYKVTISDEVNLVEFNEKYQIINQEGLIYTIREKEINNG